MTWVKVEHRSGSRVGPIMRLNKGAIRLNKTMYQYYDLGQHQSYEIHRDEDNGRAALVFRDDEKGYPMISGGKSASYVFSARWYDGPSVRVTPEVGTIDDQFALIFDVPQAKAEKPKSVKKAS